MRQYGAPTLIEDLGEARSGRVLTRVEFSRRATDVDGYDEAWLQQFVMDHPEALPVEDLEAGFVPVIPICTELPTPSGFVDNLFVTPDGGIILVECKLWRNPQARREVVGQILDYAKDLSLWTYEDLAFAVSKSSGRRCADPFAAVCREHDVDEARFIDKMTRNLRRGRFLLLILGDGIHEGVESIANFVQKHSGLHFTLGIVELGIFRVPDEKGYLIQPRVIARTVNIERGVVEVVDGQLTISPPPDALVTARVAGRRSTITEAQFYEELQAVDEKLPAALREFLAQVEPLGVTADYGQNLNLRWNPDGERKYNLGVIVRDGRVRTDPVNWVPSKNAQIEIAHGYLRSLADLVEGAFTKETGNAWSWYVRTAQSDSIPVAALLDRSADWADLVERYVEDLRKTLPDPTESI